MTDPSQQVFWFASRALGIVATILLGVTVDPDGNGVELYYEPSAR
jgi:hypothetical protein